MFVIWAWEKSKDLRDKLLYASLWWALIGGLLFGGVDLLHFENLQYGWFYRLFRLPTYADALIWAALFGWALLDSVISWGRKQYADYQAFVISGGKSKRKNGDDDDN